MSHNRLIRRAGIGLGYAAEVIQVIGEARDHSPRSDFDEVEVILEAMESERELDAETLAFYISELRRALKMPARVN